MWSYLFIIDFVASTLDVISPKKHFEVPCPKFGFPILFQEFYGFKSYIKIFKQTILS